MSVGILSNDTMEKLTNSSYLLSKINYGTVYFDELYTHIQTLYDMNIRSYNCRYDETEILDDINKNSKKKFDNICQVLKSLQCLKYNIEIEPKNMDEYNSLEWLKSQIKLIQNYLIEGMQDYKDATWF